MRAVRAFSPAGISSFFEICDTNSDGSPIVFPEIIGARGGGFGIKKGITTEAMVKPSEANNVSVFINHKETSEAKTTETVVSKLLDETEKTHDIIIRHNVEVPIGAGFGTSGAGALTAAMSLAQALNLNLTFNELGKIAHAAELQHRTGLGTVGPLMLGGCILTVEPGAPGIAEIDRLLVPPDCAVVTGVFGPITTRNVLSSPEKRSLINRWGKLTLNRILSEPSLENFMACCLEFAEKTGFMTPRLRCLAKLAMEADAVGVAQNMVGEAVHAVATPENARKVAEAFKRVLPAESVLVAEIDFQGARLIG